jgi:hypothetical protein
LFRKLGVKRKIRTIDDGILPVRITNFLQNSTIAGQNRFPSKINEEFGKENDDLQSQIDWLTKYRLPISLQQKKKKTEQDDDDGPSAKWQKKAKSKGKKPVHCTDDELEYNPTNSNSEVYEPASDEKDEKNEKRARVWFLVILFVFSDFFTNSFLFSLKFCRFSYNI